ncbi:THAP domain-containing protein 4-like [Acyrthosiphon pisum]|uniref:THAP-type domain-containing protein n=1 Tax=Acyrthosiphon pisum TaxID=7029 RepID=A0A8R2JLD0_ACYPI|nr:THAP domain-containing protein 4-like [Acyrthosiphon pisum]
MSCSAVNCTNRSSQGIRLFRFSAQLERRKIWIKKSSMAVYRICSSVHFEENQFERRRIDGWIKLKWDAIPTIFNVPNPPKSVIAKRKSKYKIPDDTTLSVGPNEIENTTDKNIQSLQSSLQMENEMLRKENDRLKRANEQFLKYLEQKNDNLNNN